MALAPQLPSIHWLPVVIFLLTYFWIAVESNTASYLDRTAATFCGAVAMVVASALTLDQAYQAINWDTLLFLLGIMILVAHFRVSGFFDWIAVRVASLARTRFELLVLLVFVSGVLSAFFVNDTVCLMFTPIVLAVTERLEAPPLPYLVALATSANIGSAMSVTGNPQNAVIGLSAHFSFLGFLAHLAPVSIVGLALNVAILALMFRKDLAGPLNRYGSPAAAYARPVDRTLLTKCAVAASLVVVLWIFNFSFPLVAASVGALIFLIGRVKSDFIHREVDWSLLLFFAALFVVIRGLEASGAIAHVVTRFEPLLEGGRFTRLLGLSGAMLVLSTLVSNLPAVLLFRPLVPPLGHAHFVWLALASASTLAGNSTPFSSVANLIVLQQASKKIDVSFWQFSRVGIVVTLVTTTAAVGILALELRLVPYL